MSQEKWLIFIILRFIVPASLSCSLPFAVPVETYDYLVGKELVILLFECVVRKMFCCVLCIFFPSWCLCWDFKFNCIDSWSLYFFLSLTEMITCYQLIIHLQCEVMRLEAAEVRCVLTMPPWDLSDD